MKNKKRVVIAFLAACVLCLAIGFATLTDTLQAGGTIVYSGSNTAFNHAVHYDNTTAEVDTTASDYNAKTKDTTPADTVTVSVGNYTDTNNEVHENDKLTITVTSDAFDTLEQKVVVTVDIINESTDAATISVGANRTDACKVDGTSDTLSKYFTVACSLSSGTIAAGGTVTLTVTITFKAIPNGELTDGVFDFDLTATVA